MKTASVQIMVKFVAVFALLLFAPVSPEVVEAISLPACTRDSDPAPLTFIDPVPCGTYGEVQTRSADSGVMVKIRYMKHTPAGPPKAVVVLIAGGNLNTEITGDAAMGTLTGAGANFLVRSAQLFADAGLLAVTINRPLLVTSGDPEFPGGSAAADPYRISPKHAFDIVRTVEAAGGAGLPLFIVGTSRGSLSAVAANMLGNGIMISSPVTSGSVDSGCDPLPACLPYWLGHPLVTQLQAGNVMRPVHVMAHKEEWCFVTTPAGAEAFHRSLVAAGKDSKFDQVNGGFDLVGVDPAIEPCDAKTHHGYLGMENKAVREITKRMDEILGELRRRFRGNQRSVAGTTTITGAPFTAVLSSLVVNPDGDPLTFSLPYLKSYRGQDLAPSGSTVTYTPPAAPPLGFTDGFVYVVSDGKGGISSGYVTVSLP